MRMPETLPANSRTSALLSAFTIRRWRTAMAWATESLASTVRCGPLPPIVSLPPCKYNLPNFRYFLSQLSDALFDGLPHEASLAKHDTWIWHNISISRKTLGLGLAMVNELGKPKR